MVIQAWRCDFKKLFIRFISKFALSLHSFLRMTFLVTGALAFGIFFIPPAEILDSNIVLQLSTISLLIWHSLSERNPNTYGQGTLSALSQINVFH